MTGQIAVLVLKSRAFFFIFHRRQRNRFVSGELKPKSVSLFSPFMMFGVAMNLSEGGQKLLEKSHEAYASLRPSSQRPIPTG